MAKPMQTDLTNYQAPTGWRIKRDHEPLADGDAFSHTHYSVAEHIAPLTFTLDRLRQDSDFAYLSDESVFAARKYYMPQGGYILTPFTPSETFAEIAPEELAHPAPSVIIIDDPTDGMETINAACGGNGGIVSALPLEEAADVGQDRSALTDADRLFPRVLPGCRVLPPMLDDTVRHTYVPQPPATDAPLLPDDYLMAGGKVATSKCPPYHLIPAVSLQMLANQCGLGVKRKGKKAWNALSDNQDVLLSREFVLERISHGINHALKMRDRILEGDFENMETENDAAAVAWCGMFLCAAADAMMKEQAAGEVD